MLIWSCNVQNNTFNNIIMVNFQDNKPQSYFCTLIDVTTGSEKILNHAL